MARIPLGDIVPLWIPGQPTPDAAPPLGPPYTLVPGLPTDLAGNFLTSYNPSNTTPPYASSEQVNPALQTEVIGGPFFVPSQPNSPAPFSRGQMTPGNPWKRQPILPDSVLPDPLKRSSQILNRSLYQANPWDLALLQESALWRWISEHGGLQSCCRIPEMGAPFYAVSPLLSKPSAGIDFKKIFFQPLTVFQSAGVFTGLDVVMGQWQVDIGYDGVINKFVVGFTGNGFNQGSGNIAWRLKVGQRFVRDFGNVLNTYGDLNTALLVQADHVELISGQTVTLIANIPAGSPVNAGQVFAGTFGYIWPRR